MKHMKEYKQKILIIPINNEEQKSIMRTSYANLKLANTAAGESWRFGTFQVDIQPDGRR